MSSRAAAALTSPPEASYINEDLTKSELIKRLKKLHEFLSAVPQTTRDVDKFKGVARSVAGAGIVSHRDKDVRLLAACCLADVVRIFAPEAPFDDAQLHAVFALFVEQLRGVASSSESPTFTLHFFLLERLASVKAFILLLDLGDELVDELFTLAFSLVAGGDLQANVVALLGDILATCVGESERLPKTALDQLLMPLTQARRRESPHAYAFARQIVQRCWESLRDEVTTLYRDAGDSELSAGSMHELIFELNRVEPRVLQNILPQLENELRVDTDEIRLAAVKLLARMFAAQGSRLHTEYAQLFAAFLSRFNDKTPAVRRVMLDFARHFAINHQHQQHSSAATASPAATSAAAIAPTTAEARVALDKELVWRLRDQVEEVRMDAVAVVCDICRQVPDALEAATIAEAAERMKDKKSAIRGDSVARFASMYNALASRAFAAEEEEDEEEEEEEEAPRVPKWWSRYESLPNKIVCCYMLGFEEDKVRVLGAFATMVGAAAQLPPQSQQRGAVRTTPTKSPQKPDKKTLERMCSSRATALLRVVRGFDAKANATFSLMLKEVRLFQREFAQFQQLRNDGAEAQQKAAAVLDWLAARIPAASAERSREYMRKIFEAKEHKPALKHLCVLANPASPLGDAEAAYGALCKQPLADAKAEYVANVARRLNSAWLANPTVAAKIIESVSTSRAGADCLVAYLISLATLFSGLVAPHMSAVIDLLEVRHLRAMMESILFVTASDASAGLEAKDAALAKKAKKRLLALCEVGTPLQAKLAVRSLAKIASNTKRELTTLLRTLADKVSLGNEDLPSVLQAISTIAQVLNDGAAVEGTALSVLNFVTDTLLKHPPQAKTKKGAAPLGTAKAHGIKLLVRFLLSLREHHALKGGPVVTQLFELLLQHGDGSDTAIEPEVRQAAACSLLRLARIKAFDQLIGPDELQKLAAVALSADPDTRAAFERRLAVDLRMNRLPLRYIAVLCFFASEPKRELFTEARSHVHQCIQARREFAKRAAPSVQKQQQLFQLLPEYALPYLVSLLAHHEGFAADGYKFAMRALFLLLSMLMHGGDDYLFLNQLVEFMRTTDDAREPQLTQNVHVACELARRIVRKAAETRSWTDKGAHPGDIFLPPQYFKPLAGEKLKALAEKDGALALPEVPLPDVPEGQTIQRAPQVPATPVKKQTGAAATAATTSPAKKRKAKKAIAVGSSIVESGDEDEETEEVEAAAAKTGPETPSRVMPRRGAKHRVSYNEEKAAAGEDDDDDDDDEAPKKKKTKKGGKTPARAATKRTRKEAVSAKQQSGGEEDEEDGSDAEEEAEIRALEHSSDAEDEAPKARAKKTTTTSPAKKKTKKKASESEEEEEEEEEEQPKKKKAVATKKRAPPKRKR